MQPGRSANTYRWALNLYFAFIAVVTLAYGLLIPRIDRSWIISDWLINYQGGFVRRGLPGEAAYLLGRLFHLTPVLFVVLFYFSLYAVFLFSFRDLLLRSSRSPWVVALLLSPATLAFPVLDMQAGFRKELIYIAALSFFLVLLRRGRLGPVEAAVYLSAAILAGTLAHESLICYSLYFFAALVLGGRTLGQAARQFAVPFALGLVAAALCARYLGNFRTASHICSSLGYPLILSMPNNQVCWGGAITYLTSTRAEALEQTRRLYGRYHYFRSYCWPLLLALAPAVAGSFALSRCRLRRELQILWGTAALSFLGSLVLFVYAIDWGRWIYIHIVSIAVLLLFLDGRARELPSKCADEPAWPRTPQCRFAAALLLAAYAGLWTLPHAVEEQPPRFGYISLAPQLQSHLHHAP